MLMAACISKEQITYFDSITSKWKKRKIEDDRNQYGLDFYECTHILQRSTHSLGN